MIYDVTAQFEEILNTAIAKQVENLPISYPCKVKSVENDGVYVTIETLLKKEKSDVDRKIPIMQSPYLTLPIQVGDIGIALNCSYLFEDAINDNEIPENQKSTKENALFFIPLVSKSKFKGKVGETQLSNKDNTSSLVLKESVTLTSQSTIEVKGVSATLGEILGDIISMLTKMNLDPVAGNGAPLNSPTLASDLPQIQAKIQGNLK